MPKSVAIVGRPNVGKSTLFNRLAGRRLALVHDQPGVTRDRRRSEAQLGDLVFDVVDTAGYDDAGRADGLARRIRAQTELAVGEADVILFLIDARAGVQPLDREFARWLRRANAPVLLVANKCEGGAGESGRLEAFELGLGEPIAVSAEHNLGMADLRDGLLPLLDQSAPAAAEWQEEVETADEAEPARVQIVVLGRPNVGKSSLLNRLLGEERLLSGPEAGITRDAIAIDWTFQGHALRLIDTAGLRRRARVAEALERLSVQDALRSLRYAHVVVLVLDAADPLEKQELTLARLVIDEGRALVFAVNKWDLVADKAATRNLIADRLEASLSQLRGVPVVELSALTGRHLGKLLPAVLRAYEVWNRRAPTAELNRWLEEVAAAHPPPLVAGRRLKLRYIAQIKRRPPTFALFASKPTELPEAYRRYLVNDLRRRFDLPGTPIRLQLRRGRNPYAKDH